MLPAELNTKIIDCPQLIPYTEVNGQKTPNFARSHYEPAEVLCSQKAEHPSGFFAAGKTVNGKYVGVWAGHADLFETLDALNANLNKHEKTLLELGVNQA